MHSLAILASAVTILGITTAIPTLVGRSYIVDAGTCTPAQTAEINAALLDAFKLAHFAGTQPITSPAYLQFFHDNAADYTTVINRMKKIQNMAFSRSKDESVTIVCKDPTTVPQDERLCTINGAMAYAVHDQATVVLCNLFFTAANFGTLSTIDAMDCANMATTDVKTYSTRGSALLHEFTHLDLFSPWAKHVYDCAYGPWWAAKLGRTLTSPAALNNADNHAWYAIVAYLNHKCATAAPPMSFSQVTQVGHYAAELATGDRYEACKIR